MGGWICLGVRQPGLLQQLIDLDKLNARYGSSRCGAVGCMQKCGCGSALNMVGSVAAS